MQVIGSKDTKPRFARGSIRPVPTRAQSAAQFDRNYSLAKEFAGVPWVAYDVAARGIIVQTWAKLGRLLNRPVFHAHGHSRTAQNSN